MKNDILKTCGILVDPFGRPDTVKTSQDIPVVHPTIKLSEDHFNKNTAFTDGTYRSLKKQRTAYKDAPQIEFDDVVGLVFVL